MSLLIDAMHKVKDYIKEVKYRCLRRRANLSDTWALI